MSQGTAAREQPDYDLTGRWPVGEDGWQVIALGRTLYPGGPFACKAVAPSVVFFFGLHFEPGAVQPGPQTAVITNFADELPEFGPSRPMSGSEKLHARQHVSAYLVAKASLFRRDPIVSVEFSAGDGRQIEVF